ncbi:cytochrome P450 [Hymenopellis radicata]|nr:cytochrome P450 [Hymenopellis radicata]
MITLWNILLPSIAGWLLLRLLKIGSREWHLPPGPPTLPLLGNLHNFPNTAEMPLRFSEWARQYGGIISVSCHGQGCVQTIIVVSSPTAVREVIDRTGWAASSRPESYLGRGAFGRYHPSFSPDTEDLRTMLTMITTFTSKYKTAMQRIVVLEGAQLLFEFLNNPVDFKSSIRRFTHSTIKTIVYGKRAPLFDCFDVNQYYKSVDAAVRIVSPGVYPPIDLLPILKYLPEYLAPWISECRSVLNERLSLHRRLFEESKSRRQELNDLEGLCFMDWVAKIHPDVDHDLVSETGIALLDGGSETTGSFFQNLVLALASHPDYQERAFAELNAAVGSRLPDYDDIHEMPFVRALIKEITRSQPILPLALSHAATADIHVSRFLVRKERTDPMFRNAINRDPSMYDNPNDFNPERFLHSEFGTIPGKDTTDFRDNFMFGGGRVSPHSDMPGQWIALKSMELITMHLIWAFEFADAFDPVNRSISPHLVVAPHPFQCTITARAGRVQDVRENFSTAFYELEQYHVDLSTEERQHVELLKSKLSDY